uniref:Ulp1 protease family, C-terminal catalytic domain-containing protein n=1 Tax=Tanacetum cinerariifolium TaxID=118510 RepID=A0A6L2KJR0_TANCI|nr:ulp1 protease family, C-terminal catalytic domain-containing protein [Tanacetum cinerariifolium]
MKKKSKIYDENNKNSKIHTRTTPTALFNAMAVLNGDRKECLDEIGFRSMIGMGIHELMGKLGFYVIDNLDTKTKVLSLTDNSILVTSQSVHDILEIPMGGCSLESLAPRSPDGPFIKEWLSQFGDKNEVRPNDITDVIISINDASKLFKMNFLMLFANTMRLCEKSGVCNMNILKKITDDVCVEKIDWCSYIITCLKESKQKWVNPDKNRYTGPVTFMILLYLHSTRCDDIDVIRKTPAIKNWKSVRMQYREKLEIEKYGGFGMLPKHEPLNLQSELFNNFIFIKMIKEKCYNVHQDLRSVKETLNEGLSRFPDCKKLNKLVKKFEEDFKKKDLVRNNENDDIAATTNDKNDLLHFDSKMESDSAASDGDNQNSVDDDSKQDVVMDEIDEQNKEDVCKEAGSIRENKCVEIRLTFKRHAWRKKSVMDNENKDAEAVELSSSIKRCGHPMKHSYNLDVKDVNEPIAEKINNEDQDSKETPFEFADRKDELM